MLCIVLISCISSPHQEALWCMLRIWRSCTTLARERMWALLGQYCSHKRLRMRSACWQGDAAFSHADKVLSEVPQAPVMCPLTSFPGCLTRPAYVRIYGILQQAPAAAWCPAVCRHRRHFPSLRSARIQGCGALSGAHACSSKPLIWLLMHLWHVRILWYTLNTRSY